MKQRCPFCTKRYPISESNLHGVGKCRFPTTLKHHHNKMGVAYNLTMKKKREKMFSYDPTTF